MKIKEKFMDFKNRLSDRHMFSIIITVIAVLLSVSIYFYKSSQDYRYALENQYRRAFSDLASNVETIETSLAKGMVTADPASLTALASDIYGKAAFAAANLGQLPLSDSDMTKTSKFLAQVGDYTYALSMKILDGRTISNDDYKTMQSLNSYAQKMGESLLKMEEQLYSGTMRFGDITRAGHAVASQVKNLNESVKDLEASFTDYPSLIYDGSFSEHIDLAEPIFLYGKGEVSLEDAQKKAKELLGDKRGDGIEHAGNGDGKISTYNFSLTDKEDEDHSVYIEITKAGGYPLLMLDNRFVGDTKISVDTAKAAAADFLKRIGFDNMQESYYEINTNTVTVNYSFRQGDIIVYPDLVKVKIALDNGEVVGFESRGYLMSHYERSLPQDIADEAKIREKLSPMVNAESAKLAIIPKSSQREVLCYEYKCTLNDKTFLIYLNAQTGHEEDILMLLETPHGTLTI